MIAGASTLFVILVGTGLAVRVSNPLLWRLEESEARHRAVLASTLDPVLTIDPAGHIRSASDSVERLFGWPPGDLVGHQARVLLPDFERSKLGEYLADFRRAGVAALSGCADECQGLHRHGAPVPKELVAAAIHGQSDRSSSTRSAIWRRSCRRSCCGCWAGPAWDAAGPATS
jgi:PAS domain S-box-containing protein